MYRGAREAPQQRSRQEGRKEGRATGHARKLGWVLCTAGTAGHSQAAPSFRRPRSTPPGSDSRPGRRGARMVTEQCQAGGPGTLGTPPCRPPGCLQLQPSGLLLPWLRQACLHDGLLSRWPQQKSRRRCCQSCQDCQGCQTQLRLAGQQWPAPGRHGGRQQRQLQALLRWQRLATAAARAGGASCGA